MGDHVGDDDCRRHLPEDPDLLPVEHDPGSPSGNESCEVAGLYGVCESHLPQDGLGQGFDLRERCLGGGGHGAEAGLGVVVPDDVAYLEDPLGQVPVLVVPQDPYQAGHQVGPEACVVLRDGVEDPDDVDLRQTGDPELVVLVAQGQGGDLAETESDHHVPEVVGEGGQGGKRSGGLVQLVCASEPLEPVARGHILVDVDIVHDVESDTGDGDLDLVPVRDRVHPHPAEALDHAFGAERRSQEPVACGCGELSLGGGQVGRAEGLVAVVHDDRLDPSAALGESRRDDVQGPFDRLPVVARDIDEKVVPSDSDGREDTVDDRGE